jgi:hypothetical protein
MARCLHGRPLKRGTRLCDPFGAQGPTVSRFMYRRTVAVFVHLQRCHDPVRGHYVWKSLGAYNPREIIGRVEPAQWLSAHSFKCPQQSRCPSASHFDCAWLVQHRRLCSKRSRDAMWTERTCCGCHGARLGQRQSPSGRRSVLLCPQHIAPA